MKKGAEYLRGAAVCAFLALAAWALAFFVTLDNRPDTVTARLEECEKLLSIEGIVLRDEAVVICADEDASLTCRTGDRVRGGFAIAESADGNGSTVLAPCGGIFSSLVDGYEGMTYDSIGSYQPHIPSFAVGKIVSGGWYIAASSDEVLSVGARVTVLLPDECEATVVHSDGQRLILRCFSGLEEVINIRQAEFTLRLARARGIRLPDNAVERSADGCFVYVLRAGLAEKLPVEIVFDGDGFCLVREGRLRQGMEVILGSSDKQNKKYL